MQRGTDGPAMVLTDLRPGDELLIVMVDDGKVSAAPSASAAPAAPGAPSALPRQATAGGPTEEANELMVFRNEEAP